MARMDRVRVGPTVSALRQQLKNWYFVGPLAWLVMLSPLRHVLERTALPRRLVWLRFRDGRVLRLHLGDMQIYVEIFILEDYDVPGLDWRTARGIVDVGANVGAATLWMASRSPDARLIAIEPAAASRALMRQNLQANGLVDRVDIVAAAVGGRSGEAYVQPGPSSILNRVTADPGAGERVAMVTMDDILAGPGTEFVDLLKLDCEGSEYEILLAGSRTWLSRVGTIVGEWHPSTRHPPSAIVGALEEAGFSVEVQPHPALPGFGNFIARRPGASGRDERADRGDDLVLLEGGEPQVKGKPQEA